MSETVSTSMDKFAEGKKDRIRGNSESSIKIFFHCLFIFERERESAREHTSRGGTEREGDTESEAGSRLRAVNTEPDRGLELTNREIITWVEVGGLTD